MSTIVPDRARYAAFAAGNLHLGNQMIAIRSSVPLRQAIAITCVFFSGFLSLAYEICWVRQASMVFGTTTFALSTVVAVFFAGLAIGSYVSGRYLCDFSRPWLVYATIEATLGILVILSPIGFAVADDAFGWLYPSIFEYFWALCSLRLLLVASILLPPSVLMGATFPLFCRCFVRNSTDVQRNIALVYGMNTLGAALGCATCGLLLLPLIGADLTLQIGGICNLAIAVITCVATRLFNLRHPKSLDGKTELTCPASARPSLRNYVLATLFFLTGFVALGHEIVWTRFLSLLIYNSVYTYTITLTVTLIGIVLGSCLAATKLLRNYDPAMVFGCLQTAIAMVVLGTLFLPAACWQSLRHFESLTAQLSLFVLIRLPSAALAGIAFPVAARLIINEADESAAKVGWLSAINTSGGLAGSLFVGFVVLPSFGLHITVLITTAASAICGLVAWWWIDEHFSRRTKLSLTVISCGVWFLIPFVSRTRLPADFLAERGNLVEFREGLTGHLAVVRHGDGLRLEVDRLWQGGNRPTHQVVAAHLPMALHHDPRRILVVGLGPGQTASRFLMYPVEQLDCVEIESGLIGLLPQHFNGEWLADPRVRCIIEDGRNFIRHTDQRYDVISLEVGQAFRPGVAAFYTRDFYECALEKLRPDGLLTQFVSLEFFNCDELRSVIGTFAKVFPECALFHNRTELLLIGKRDGELVLSHSWLKSLSTKVELQRDLDFCYWGAANTRLSDPHVFAANYLMGGGALSRLAGDARIAQDDIPWLEFSTSSHGTPDILAAKALIERHLTPVQSLFRTADAPTETLICSVRQRNLDTLECDECVWQAHRLRRKGLREEALNELRSALHLNPDHVNARVLLGDILVQLGHYSVAIDELRAAHDRNPELTHIRVRLKALKAISQAE